MLFGHPGPGRSVEGKRRLSLFSSWRPLFLERKQKMEIKSVVLASASPRRKELLLQIGIQPEIVVSHVVGQVTSSVPSEVVMELASQKAADVAAGERPGEDCHRL